MKRIAIAASLAGLVCLWAGPLAHAQTMGTARGKVLDEKGQPIEGVNVKFEYLGDVNHEYQVETNKKGEYTQIGIYPGTYRATFSKEGFQGSYIDQRIRIGEPTYLPDITLRSQAALQQAATAQSDTLREDFKAANDLIRDGKYPEAAEVLKKLLEDHPDVPQIHHNLGYVYREMKDWAAAEAAYQQALDLDPDLGDARVGLARVYKESGQDDKAAALFESAESQADPKLQFDLGLGLLNEMKTEEAYAAFSKAEELGSDNTELQYHMGTLALNLGRLDEAIERLERYLAGSPSVPENKQTAEGLLAALKPKN